MFNKAQLCRKQEAHHRQVAANTTLENVRKIALTAAKVWALEADTAEKREASRGLSVSASDAAFALEFQQEEEAERRFVGPPDARPIRGVDGLAFTD